MAQIHKVLFLHQVIFECCLYYVYLKFDLKWIHVAQFAHMDRIKQDARPLSTCLLGTTTINPT
jgi:hypothetical protein